MSLFNFDQESLGKKLNEVLSPSRPVKSVEYLIGRDDQLKSIERALYQTGRHVFIYGDRGVGKSSLAATAAVQYQSSDKNPIFVSGSVDETFKTIIANIAIQALERSKIEDVKKEERVGINWRGISIGSAQEVSNVDISSQIQSVGDAVELLKQVAALHSEKPIVVLDEFDAIVGREERDKFASLLKQLGDQGVNLKFIFTGIAKSVGDLLDAHHSAFRQLLTVELSRLGWEARREIVCNAAREFGLEINDNVNWRIAIVSDGYPYYVHLITEQMLWAAYDAEESVEELSSDLYYLGLREAIKSINAELKKPYEYAVIGRNPQYENIVWSTADGDDLIRSLKDMYLAYKRIMEKRGYASEIVEADKYSLYVRQLKTKAFGEVLESNRATWYSYKEKMLRGYVRMQAEANGIELTGESATPRQTMHVPNVRTGYKGSTIPKGVKLRG